MANLLAGFVKGFADNQVDQIGERRKLENEEKKAKMLAQLQSETQRANFLFEEGYKKSNKIDENMSSKDFKTGKITMRALDGSELGSRDMTQAEKDTYANDALKDDLDIQGKRQNMTNDNIRLGLDQQRLSDSRAERAENRSERAQDRAERKAERLGGLDSSGGGSVADVARTLRIENQDFIKAYEAKGLDPIVTAKISENIAAHGAAKKWGLAETQRRFNMALEEASAGSTTGSPYEPSKVRGVAKAIQQRKRLDGSK